MSFNSPMISTLPVGKWPLKSPYYHQPKHPNHDSDRPFLNSTYARTRTGGGLRRNWIDCRRWRAGRQRRGRDGSGRHRGGEHWWIGGSGGRVARENGSQDNNRGDWRRRIINLKLCRENIILSIRPNPDNIIATVCSRRSIWTCVGGVALLGSTTVSQVILLILPVVKVVLLLGIWITQSNPVAIADATNVNSAKQTESLMVLS